MFIFILKIGEKLSKKVSKLSVHLLNLSSSCRNQSNGLTHIKKNLFFKSRKKMHLKNAYGRANFAPIAVPSLR